MKAMKIVCAIAALIINTYLPAYSDTVTIKTDPLPKSGTYFIISALSHDTLQPNAPSLGQSVFLSEYNQGGTQKWTITRKIDPVTKKPTNRYTIRLAGENKELNLQPHPSIADAAPILGTDSAVFALEPGQDGLLVKSVEKNGDAMSVYQASDRSRPIFAPNDGSNKFRWSFLSAESASAAISVSGLPLPDTGTYFIINASNNEALQPNAPSLGQTVFLSEYNKGGTQKWTINRKIDPVTKKPTNRYSIKLAGENEELNFQPHPSVNDGAPILGLDKSIFVFEPSQDGLLIKSVTKNGDALFFTQSSENAEPQFGPDDGSKKFRWNFIRPE